MYTIDSIYLLSKISKETIYKGMIKCKDTEIFWSKRHYVIRGIDWQQYGQRVQPIVSMKTL